MVSFCACGHLIVIAFVTACWHKKLSGRVWTLIRYESLYFRDRRGALRSLTEIAFIRGMIFIQAQKLSG